MIQNIENDYLTNIKYENTIPFIPPITSGKVIKVYDGDTITIATKLNISDIVYRFPVRIRGIDCPEIRGKNEHEKELAIDVKKILNGMLMNRIITLKNVATEKYGRILADVYLENMSIAEWLLQNNYAVKYNGGEKIRPDEWNS